MRRSRPPERVADINEEVFECFADQTERQVIASIIFCAP
jgi:hypothetical protein